MGRDAKPAGVTAQDVICVESAGLLHRDTSLRRVTERFPQVGQWSSGATGVLDEAASSPGPLLFWLLAVPVRLPWPSAPAVALGALNVASVVGMVALARRRRGRPLMFAVALAVPVMLMSLPAETYSDVWTRRRRCCRSRCWGSSPGRWRCET
jgi:hypothetical protein